MWWCVSIMRGPPPVFCASKRGDTANPAPAADNRARTLVANATDLHTADREFRLRGSSVSCFTGVCFSHGCGCEPTDHHFTPSTRVKPGVFSGLYRNLEVLDIGVKSRCRPGSEDGTNLEHASPVRHPGRQARLVPCFPAGAPSAIARSGLTAYLLSGGSYAARSISGRTWRSLYASC